MGLMMASLTGSVLVDFERRVKIVMDWEAIFRWQED